MWGKRNRQRREPAEARPDEWGACEYLDDGDRPRTGEDDEAAAGLGWRAARHGRPEDWPSRPAPPPA